MAVLHGGSATTAQPQPEFRHNQRMLRPAPIGVSECLKTNETGRFEKHCPQKINGTIFKNNPYYEQKI
jgi:hypothetical protein